MRKKTYNFFKNTIVSIIENDFSGMAAEMSYMLVIGIFPFMLFLVSLFNLIGKNYYMNPLFIFLEKVMPADSLRLIHTVLNQVLGFTSGRSVAIFGLLVTLFMSMNALSVVIKGLNRAYKVEETRNFIYTRILSFLMVFVNVLVMFLTINIIIFGKVIIMFLVTHFGMSKGIAITILTLRWPVAFLALYLMAFLSYYILPDLRGNESFKRKSALPGTLFFTTFWLVGSWGFSIYVNNLSTYNLVYGTIGAFFILMVWLYYTSILLLIGGEINSQVYNQLEHKSRELHEEIAELKSQIKRK